MKRRWGKTGEFIGGVIGKDVRMPAVPAAVYSLRAWQDGHKSLHMCQVAHLQDGRNICIVFCYCHTKACQACFLVHPKMCQLGQYQHNVYWKCYEVFRHIPVSAKYVGWSDKSSKTWFSPVKIGISPVKQLGCFNYFYRQCMHGMVKMKFMIEKCPVKD